MSRVTASAPDRVTRGVVVEVELVANKLRIATILLALVCLYVCGGFFTGSGQRVDGGRQVRAAG